MFDSENKNDDNIAGAEEVLHEEIKKKPCAHYQTGHCQFGLTCRFSHYSPADLSRIQQIGPFNLPRR